MTLHHTRQASIRFQVYGLLLVIACFGLFLPMVAGSGVAVGVDQERQGTLIVTGEETADDQPRVWEVEARNDGSQPFTGRIRLDVLDDNDTVVFRTWSDILQIAPGSFSVERLAYYGPEREGDMTARLVLHHGTDRVTVYRPFSTEQQEIRTGFDVSSAWTTEEVAAFRIAAPQDVDAFYVSVDDWSTRRYAQTQVENRGGAQIVELDYHPEVLDRETAHVTVSSTDGTYHYTAEVELQRSEGAFDTLRRWAALIRQNLPII